jgi:RNA polymerase sigma factor (sigma-70 family)
MARSSLDNVLHYARALGGGVADLPEPCLLDRFLSRADEAAFASLIERHGPMVLSVCRRVLGNAHDAEDAFQATFLVLARRAGSLRRRASVAGWLYGVACRVAWRARADAARRRLHERRAQALRPEAPAAEVPPDLGDVLGEELARLPEAYRQPVVLCHLEGLTNEEAARRLGWPVGSVKGRLFRARELLRSRLARRGLAPTVALLDAALAGQTAEAVPAALAEKALRAALARGPAAAEAVSAPVTALARAALRQGPWARFRLALAVVVLLAVLGGAAALVPGGAAPAPAGQPVRPAAPDPKPPAGPPPAAVAPIDLHGDPLPPGARARLGTVRFREGSGIAHIAYSPDGKLLISMSQVGEVAFWDAATGRRLRELPGKQGRWAALACSRDGKFLATSGEDGAVKLWDAAAGKEVRRLPGHKGRAALAFSPSSKLLASAGADGQLVLWEVATGKELRRQQVAKQSFCCVAFSPDGKTVLAGGHNGGLQVWDLATGGQPRERPEVGWGVFALGFSPGGKILAAGTTNNEVVLWDMASGKLLRRLPAHKGYIRGIAFLGDGDVLAVGHYVSSLLVREPPGVRFWDVHTGKEVRVLHDCDATVESIALSPDGRTLAVADSCSIRRWDLQTGNELPPHAEHHGGVRVLGVSVDGKTVFTGCEEGVLRQWDTTTGKVLRSYKGHRSCVQFGGLSADGKVLCSGGPGPAVFLWDPNQARPRLELPVPKNSYLRTIALAADGRTLATVPEGHGLFLWDTATGKQLRRIGPEERPYCIGFSPDGKTLASGGWDSRGHRCLKFWDLATGKELAANFDVGWLHAVAFSPDGQWLAACEVANRDATDGVQLYDTRAKEIRRFRGHRGIVYDVAFAPDGWTLASGGQDGTVRLWELATGQERRVLRGHPGGVGSLAFSADGRTLISSAGDSTVLVWDLAAPGGKAAPPKAQLEQDWAALSSPDAPRAYEAICRLAAFPKQSVPLLRERLLGLKEGPEQVRRWIRELDDRRFVVRERAMVELKKLGRQVEADLRRALTQAPPEARRRLERLLADLPRGPAQGPTGGSLQRLRALEVLDRAGTAEARQVVEALAAGPADSSLTRQARAVLRRLGK